jgi:hypothetical protein
MRCGFGTTNTVCVMAYNSFVFGTLSYSALWFYGYNEVSTMTLKKTVSGMHSRFKPLIPQSLFALTALILFSFFTERRNPVRSQHRQTCHRHRWSCHRPRRIVGSIEAHRMWNWNWRSIPLFHH